ncbi:MAG: hypothetical protein JWL79_3806 [Frankiales bacterium]|nr:hypothetical protein [Frankiales bacterium]
MTNPADHADLEELLRGEAARQYPRVNRPFSDLLDTRRVRDRRAHLVAAATVLVVVTTGVALAISSSGRGHESTVVTDPGTPACSLSALDMKIYWSSSPPSEYPSPERYATLIAANQTSGPCIVAAVPVVVPLTADGRSATTTTPGSGNAHDVLTLPPGQKIASSLTWRSYCGADVGKEAQVYLPSDGADPVGIKVAEDHPEQPQCVAGMSSGVEAGRWTDTVPQVNDGKPIHDTTGVLQIVGGPSGQPQTVTGIVTFTAADGSHSTVPVAGNGAFEVVISPGTYTVTGTSPSYREGAGVCRAERPVTVTFDAGARNVMVNCSAS